MSKHQGPTEAQMTALLVTQGVIATCAVVTLLSAARAALKVREGVQDAQDFVRGAKEAL